MMTSNSNNNLELGIRCFEENNMPKARMYFSEHLKNTPSDYVANKALGVIYFHEKDYETALKHLFTANRLSSEDIEVLNLIGAIYMETGQYVEAHHYFEEAIKINPNYIDGIYNLGLLYFKSDNFQTAINAFSHLLKIKNDHTGAKIYSALSYESLKDYKKTIEILRPLITKLDNKSTATYSLTRCYIKLNDYTELKSLINSTKDLTVLFEIAGMLLENNLAEESVKIYKDIENTYPDTPSLLNNLASAYDKLDNTDKAIETFKQCINDYPDFPIAYSNFGRILGDINQPDEAITILKKGISLAPDSANAYINLGRAYEILENYSEAYNNYVQALNLQPNMPNALYNIGNIYERNGEYHKAIDYYNKCLSASPDHLDATLNLGICELTVGDFSHGWGHYFQRNRNLRDDETLSTITPGLNYKNKKLYFRFNQGLGDELLFLRFIPLLKEQGAHITYRCQNKLYDLLKYNTNIDVLINEDSPTPIADYYFSIDDAPLILNIGSTKDLPWPFKLSIPSSPKIDNLNLHFDKLPRPFMGITWRAGSQEKKVNFKTKERNLSKEFPLEQMISLLNGFKGTIFILQRNPSPEEILTLKSAFPDNLVDTSDYNEDLVKMSNLLDFIDDSICVSNTNVHLLAGLQKTCNVLIPFPPDWRWMDLEGNSPWFPDIDTFRQLRNGSWENAIESLKNKLEKIYGNSHV